MLTDERQPLAHWAPSFPSFATFRTFVKFFRILVIWNLPLADRAPLDGQHGRLLVRRQSETDLRHVALCLVQLRELALLSDRQFRMIRRLSDELLIPVQVGHQVQRRGFVIKGVISHP